MRNRNVVIIMSAILFCVVLSLFACPLQPPYCDDSIQPNEGTVYIGETVTFTTDDWTCPNGGSIEEYQWILPPQAYCVQGDHTAQLKCKFFPASSTGNPYVVQLRVKCSHGIWNDYSSDPVTTTVTVVASSGSTWFVSPAGNDDNDGQSNSVGGSPDYSGAFRNIQTAIDSAIDGQEICVLEGTYYEQLDMKGKSLNIHSYKPKTGSGWELAPETTIIDANKQGTAVLFRGSEKNGPGTNDIAELRGFTIRNGHPAEAGLAVYLKFDEAEGVTTDSSDKSRNCNLQGAETVTNGYSGNALHFTKSQEDYITIDTYKGIAGTHARTISVWIKTNDTTTGSIIHWGTDDNTGQLWYLRRLSSGIIQVAACGGGVQSTTSIMDNTNWHHIAAVLEEGESDSNQIKLYIDGQLEGQATTEFTTINTILSGPVCIGKRNWSETNKDYYEGYLDELRIYSRALSQGEVEQLSLSGPVAHWELNAGYVENSVTKTLDSTTGGHHATLHNMSNGTWSTGRIGNALYFDGSNDYVEVSGYNGISGTSARTVNVWFKTSTAAWYSGSSLPYNMPLVQWGHDDNIGELWMVYLRPDRKACVAAYGGGAYSNAALNDGAWHNLIAILPEGEDNSENILLYVDGRLDSAVVGSCTINTHINSPLMPVYIGAWKSTNGTISNYFQNMIDDVRIYDRVISQDEILHMAGDVGLVGYWHLDGNVNDSSGNALNGSIHGDATWNNGLQQQALELDGGENGNNDYGVISNNPALDFTGAFTLSAWVRPSEDIIQDGRIIYRYDPTGTNDAYFLSYGTSGWRFYVRDNGSAVSVYSDTVPTKGVWTHIVGRRNANGLMELFINGVKQTQTATKTGNISSDDLYLGIARALDCDFKGLIDEVKIYNIAIEDSEIQFQYSQRFAAGGGIRGNGAKAAITRCIIKQNESATDGGGIFNLQGAIFNNVIVNNDCNTIGGGLAFCDGTIINNTIANNSATEAGGGIADCLGTIKNNIVWGNLAPVHAQIADSNTPSYSTIQNWTGGGTGNITCEPNFVDPNNGDFHLLPVSMAIDSGDPSSSFANEPQPNGDRINMGSYGNTPEATAAPDTDNDGLTNRQEIALGFDPYNYDMDGDLLPDGWEYDHRANGFNPNNANDAVQDFDMDDLPNVWEYLNNLDPADANSINGASGDPDGDGVTNYDEYSYNLNPWEDNRGLYETQNEYDDAGQVVLTRTIEVKNDGTIYVTETQTQYDVLGRQIVQRQVAVPGKGPGHGADDTRDRLTLTQYDLTGNVKKTAQKLQFSGLAHDTNNLIIDDVNDVVTENVYNYLGQLEKTINPENYETSYTYTDEGKVLTVTDPNGKVTTNIYDGTGRLQRVVNPLGHSQTMSYDSLGQVLRQISWQDTNKTPANFNDDTPLMQQRYVYDGMGHVTRQAVLASAASSSSYTINTNVDKVTDFVYDGANDDYPGMLSAQKIYYGGNPATVATTTYDYDLLGRQYMTTDPANNVTLITYDDAGRVKRREQTDIHPISGQSNLVQATEYAYDNFGRLERLIADPNNWTDSQTTEYAYGLSWRVMETKPNGVINSTYYNTFGQKVTHVADSAGTGAISQTTVWDYDRVGRMVTITGYCDDSDTGDDQTTVYAYDKLGNVKQITYPDTKTIQYTYNDVGMVWRRIDQRQLRTYYLYNAAGSLTLKTNDPNDGGDRQLMADPNNYDPNGIYFAESFTYDGLGRQLTAQKTVDSNAISASVFAYYDKGLLHTEAQTLFGGTQRTVTYGYDQVGFRTQTAYPDGSTTITRTNTFDGRINTLSRGQMQLAAFQYLGSRTARRAYNTSPAVNTDYAYDHLGRVTAIDAGTSRAKFTYTYDADENNIDKMVFHHRGSTVYNNYDYDDLDRVTRADYLVNQQTNIYEAFNMDDLGNRSGNQTLRNDGTVNFAVDTETNRYTSVAGHTLAYDDAGNLTIDKDGYHYVYDTENRPVRIYKLNGQTQVTVAVFDYDTQGRRIRKIVYDSVPSVATLYYYSDNWQVLAEYNGTGTLQAYYVYGNYIDETLLMRRNNADYFYLHDHLFSPAALLDNTGSVVERYEYDAYGKATVWNTALTTTYSISQYGNHVLFTGREVDHFDNNNLKLQYNRNRYLSQYMGRWFSPDPLNYIDGANLYEYAISNPVIYFDNKGLASNSINFGSYTLMGDSSSDETPMSANHINQIVDSFSTYGLLPYDNVEGVGKIRKAVRDVYRSWLNGGSPDAGDLLRHYYQNHGPGGNAMIGNIPVGAFMSIKSVNYLKMINDVWSARHHVRQQMTHIASTVSNYPILASGQSIMISETEPRVVDVSTTNSRQMNWARAIHGYETWHKATNIKCSGNWITADFTTYLRDIYDYEDGYSDFDDWWLSNGLKGLSPNMLRTMHRIGVMREFYVTGETSSQIRWERGSVIVHSSL